MTVAPEYLVKGYALALEQCGMLVRDAVRLYETGSYATAVVLAAFAWEELGRSETLLDLWRRQRGGQSVTVDDIKAECGDHVDKQRAGMLSKTMRADRETRIGKILADRRTNDDPQSQEAKESDAILKQIDKRTAKHRPTERFNVRLQALYVDPSDSGWNRPADMSAQRAHDVLLEAINDYRGRYNHGYTSAQSTLKDTDIDFYNALEQLADRPQLPAPEQPSWPKRMP